MAHSLADFLKAGVSKSVGMLEIMLEVDMEVEKRKVYSRWILAENTV